MSKRCHTDLNIQTWLSNNMVSTVLLCQMVGTNKMAWCGTWDLISQNVSKTISQRMPQSYPPRICNQSWNWLRSKKVKNVNMIDPQTNTTKVVIAELQQKYIQNECCRDLRAFPIPIMSKCLGFCNLKLKLSGASIVLHFHRPKRMESYKNEKSYIFVPHCKQMIPTLFHILILNSFKKSKNYTYYIIFKKHLNNC